MKTHHHTELAQLFIQQKDDDWWKQKAVYLNVRPASKLNFKFWNSECQKCVDFNFIASDTDVIT